MSTDSFDDIKFLEDKFGAMSVGLYIKAFREADGISQTAFAKKLKISRANLCDIEKGRKLVSAERAARIAKKLKIPETTMIQLALQDLLNHAHLNYKIELKKVA